MGATILLPPPMPRNSPVPGRDRRCSRSLGNLRRSLSLLGDDPPFQTSWHSTAVWVGQAAEHTPPTMGRQIS